MKSRIWVNVAPFLLFIPSLIIALIIGFYPTSAEDSPAGMFDPDSIYQRPHPIYLAGFYTCYNVYGTLISLDYDDLKSAIELETRLETANVIETEGTLIQTAYFEFTIPEAWLGKVEFEPSGSGYGYNLYYTLGRTQEAVQYGYQQSIFSIEIYDQQEDLEVARSRKERFDILGEKDGFTYVLTQRTDSALEFYSAAYHEEIRYMRRGYEFPQIIASFTLY